MCGRLNVSDDPFVTQLLLELGIENPRENMHFGRFKRATNTVSIVREKNGKRLLAPATWWLLLEPTETGFKPSKYTSFNTRYDKLNTPRSAGYKAFRQSRCIIPAKGFGETEYVNKKPKHYYDFEAVDGAIAFGGLCREWVHQDTDEQVLSCSVITLPPHDKLKHIHSKAMPLMLPQTDSTMDMWLDENIKDVAIFDDLLKPNIPHNLKAWPIDKPSSHQVVGDEEIIYKDN